MLFRHQRRHAARRTGRRRRSLRPSRGNNRRVESSARALRSRKVMRGGIAGTKVDVVITSRASTRVHAFPLTRMNTPHEHPHARTPPSSLRNSQNHRRRSASRNGESPLQPRLSTPRRGRSRHPFHPHREGALSRSRRRRHHRRHRLRRCRMRIARRRSLARVAA